MSCQPVFMREFEVFQSSEAFPRTGEAKILSTIFSRKDFSDKLVCPVFYCLTILLTADPALVLIRTK